jgi:hypothetical protein
MTEAGERREREEMNLHPNPGVMVNAKNSFQITRKTRFLKKAGFPDLSGNRYIEGALRISRTAEKPEPS